MGETRQSATEGAVNTPGTPNHAADEAREHMATQKPSTSPAFQFYPKDFLMSAKVRRMSLTERGAYITLLALCWLDGSLPADPTALSYELHIPQKQFDRMWRGILGTCFEEKNGRLINERLNRERHKQVEFRRRASDFGKRGGRPNRKGNPSEAERVPLSDPLQKQKGQESSPISNLQSSTPVQPPAGVVRRPSTLIPKRRFDAAWEGQRVYVPQRLHSDFIAFRNHAEAEAELLAWYGRVADEWTTGARKDDADFTPDMIRFWKDRYAEEWPQKRPAPAQPARASPHVPDAEATRARRREVLGE